MKRHAAAPYLAVALTSTALATVQPAFFPETEAAWLTGLPQADRMQGAGADAPAPQAEARGRTH